MSIIKEGKNIIGVYKGDIPILKIFKHNNLVYQLSSTGGTETQYDITAKFDVNSTTSKTKLCNSGQTSAFTEMYVDGVQINVTSGYTFSTTGEHTVNYVLADKTKIYSNTFSGCTSLTSVYIENIVKEIGYYAFENCTSLTEIVIPESITNIGQYAFKGCSSLTEIVIPDSVRFISNGCLYNCSSLTSVTIGSGVTSIGLVAFNGCTSLKSVTIPDSVTRIGSSFKNCSGLTSVTIGSGVTSIGDAAFDGCMRLDEITCLATTAPTLGTDIFVNLPTQGTLYIPNGSDYSTWTNVLTSWTIQFI